MILRGVMLPGCCTIKSHIHSKIAQRLLDPRLSSKPGEIRRFLIGVSDGTHTLEVIKGTRLLCPRSSGSRDGVLVPPSLAVPP